MFKVKINRKMAENWQKNEKIVIAHVKHMGLYLIFLYIIIVESLETDTTKIDKILKVRVATFPQKHFCVTLDKQTSNRKLLQCVFHTFFGICLRVFLQMNNNKCYRKWF